LNGIVEAVSLDELLLVMRRSSGLNFDRSLPGFHFYGTDICLQADARGLQSYIIPGFCLHNSDGIRNFPIMFWKAYFHMRRKWWDRLPIETCCIRVTRHCGEFFYSLFSSPRRAWQRFYRVGRGCPNPSELYDSLGRAQRFADLEIEF
jgi:hypothetical protein